MYVNRNMNTDLALKANIQGIVRVEINFIIDKEGNPVNITVSGGPSRPDSITKRKLSA